ncbi:MAG: hypothetical protein AAGG53_09640 [Cyanobacteria bacterium P01_H01_bin.152]
MPLQLGDGDLLIHLAAERLESDEALDTVVETHDPKKPDRHMFIM